MKELEKTKRISIASVLFILIVVIGFLTFKKPEFTFIKNGEKTLEFMVDNSHIISLDEFDTIAAENYSLIDVRSRIDYGKGHMNNAINIPLNEILTKESQTFLNSLNAAPKRIILYGDSPDEANMALITLYQLGYENLSLLSIRTSFLDNELVIDHMDINKSDMNYALTLEKARIQPTKKITVVVQQKPKKKKVITQPKKKKRMPEGGC